MAPTQDDLRIGKLCFVQRHLYMSNDHPAANELAPLNTNPTNPRAMTADDLTVVAIISKELRESVHHSMGNRAKVVPQYVEKATFYVVCVRAHRGIPHLAVPDPAHPGNPALRAWDKAEPGAGGRAHWFTAFCLRSLRGLGYPGSMASVAPGAGATADQRLEFVYRRLGIDAAGTAHRTGHGEQEFYRLMRYKTWDKLRRLGKDLVRKRLVPVANGVPTGWTAACVSVHHSFFRWLGEFR